MNIIFLNVDLEIESYEDLSGIFEEFGDETIELYCGKHHNHYLATFELNSELLDPDSIIAYFCTLIENFAPKTKELWNNAFSKVFDLGYESGLKPLSYCSNISWENIQRMSKLGASLRITIYPVSERQEIKPQNLTDAEK